MKIYILILLTVLFAKNILSQDSATVNKFIGVKSCGMCHKTEKQGKQFDIWQQSKHANAYKELLSEKAIEIGKEKKLAVPPSESPECLSCHTLGFALDSNSSKNLDKNFVIEEGVQCETCHGAGSNYKTMNIMKDKAKSIANGMHDFKNDLKIIEEHCKTCHNEKSPTSKEFNFTEMWEKIKHPLPPK